MKTFQFWRLINNISATAHEKRFIESLKSSSWGPSHACVLKISPDLHYIGDPIMQREMRSVELESHTEDTIVYQT